MWHKFLILLTRPHVVVKCSKKIELRLCIKWARHFLVEGVKVKVFVTVSSFCFSFESWAVGSRWIFLQEMKFKKWKISANSNEYDKGRTFEVSFTDFFPIVIFIFGSYFQVKCSFLIAYRKFIQVYNAQKQQESLKILLHSLTHFWISFTTHQAETNVNNELFIPPCTVSHMWTCFCLNIIVHVLFTKGDSSENRMLRVFLLAMSYEFSM